MDGLGHDRMNGWPQNLVMVSLLLSLRNFQSSPHRLGLKGTKGAQTSRNRRSHTCCWMGGETMIGLLT
eukprot:1643644-Pyramimonas_sp.AAC.1